MKRVLIFTMNKVLIASGTESKVMKYKKAQPLLEDGWTLVEA